MFQNILAWLDDNKSWIFSGIGVTIVGLIGAWFLKPKSRGKVNQVQKAGDSSTNIQVGGNVEINKTNKK